MKLFVYLFIHSFFQDTPTNEFGFLGLSIWWLFLRSSTLYMEYEFSKESYSAFRTQISF